MVDREGYLALGGVDFQEVAARGVLICRKWTVDFQEVVQIGGVDFQEVVLICRKWSHLGGRGFQEVVYQQVVVHVVVQVVVHGDGKVGLRFSPCQKHHVPSLGLSKDSAKTLTGF